MNIKIVQAADGRWNIKTEDDRHFYNLLFGWCAYDMAKYALADAGEFPTHEMAQGYLPTAIASWRDPHAPLARTGPDGSNVVTPAEAAALTAAEMLGRAMGSPAPEPVERWAGQVASQITNVSHSICAEGLLDGQDVPMDLDMIPAVRATQHEPGDPAHYALRWAGLPHPMLVAVLIAAEEYLRRREKMSVADARRIAEGIAATADLTRTELRRWCEEAAETEEIEEEEEADGDQ